MLEKLLSNLRNRLKLKPNISDLSVPKETEANLLPGAEYVDIIEASLKRNTSIYQACLVFISLLFAFFLLVNDIMDFYLVRLKNVQKEAVLVHNSMIQVEKDYEDLLSKIDFYKEASNKKYIGEKVSFVVSNVTEPIIPKYYKVDREKFNITVQSPQTTYVTGLILKYLADGKVNELILKKATLDNENNVYLVELEGKFAQ